MIMKTMSTFSSCFYQFLSFFQSLFSNLTDAGSFFIFDTMNTNTIELICDDSDTLAH